MVWLEEHVYPLGNGQGLPHPVKVSEPCMHVRTLIYVFIYHLHVSSATYVHISLDTVLMEYISL